MCLSNVYEVSGGQRNLLYKNIADIRMKDGKLIFTDIMGIRREEAADIDRIDLMDSYIWIRRRASHGEPAASES